MTSPDNSRHVEVKDGDHTVTTGSRARLVDAVMGLPEVQAAIPPASPLGT